MPIQIRPIVDLAGCADLQYTHNLIWSNTADEIIPTHVLITWAHNDCVLLGAYADDGPAAAHGMVGFALGWYGLTHAVPATLKYCSHIVGVLSEYRGCDIGLKLKQAQRQQLLAHGQTTLMTWTYDPLQIVNGTFNIHRLGAVCSTYKRDVYGEMTDALNAGAPSDRFEAEWHLTDERTERHLAQQYPDWGGHYIAYPVAVVDNMPQPVEMPRWDGQTVAIPLPEHLALLRTHDTARLHAWRMMQRQYFEAAFGAGYQVDDCVQIPARGWHYLVRPRT
jgi:predicted GNAT superfamily acetyltransferase